MKFEKCLKTGKSRPIFVCSQEVHDKIRALGYSTPTLITDYGAFYYLCDRPPTASEPDCYTDISDFYYQWIDQTNEQVWNCLSNAADNMVWQNTQAGTVRDYSFISSPAFSTVYTPNLINDVFVSAIVSLTSTLLIPSQVSAVVNGNTIAVESLSGLGATDKRTFKFLVPIGQTFELTNDSGTASIISVATLIN